MLVKTSKYNNLYVGKVDKLNKYSNLSFPKQKGPGPLRKNAKKYPAW